MSIDIKQAIKQAIVAEPCPAKWDDMIGDDKIRLCAQCNLNVHNTRMMTDEEVLQLVLDAASGKRVCARLYKRADGTLLTQNCPVGVSRLRERVKCAAAWAAGALAFLVSTAVQAAPGKQGAEQGKKPVFHGTVQTDTPGVTRVTNKPSATAAPAPTAVNIGGSFDGQMVAVPSSYLTAAARKSLCAAEAKFGKNSAEAAYEHQRLGVLLETAPPTPDTAADLVAAEKEFEIAYQIQKTRGDKEKARSVAQLHLGNEKIKDAGIKSRWQARAKAD